MEDGDCRPMTDPESGRDAVPVVQRAQRLLVDVVDDAGNWSSFERAADAVEAAARMVSEAAELELSACEATVALSSDAVVRELNRAYRAQDKATNVLSFPSLSKRRSDGGGRVHLGDVVLAAETVIREADTLGIPPVHHLQHLVIHGLLHLLGHDHETDADAEAMEELESRLLARLGVADPYGGPAQ